MQRHSWCLLECMCIQSTHFMETTYTVALCSEARVQRHTNPFLHCGVNKACKCINARSTHIHTLFKFNRCEQSDKAASGSLIQQPFREAYHHFQPLNTIADKAALLFWGKSSLCRVWRLIEHFFPFLLSYMLAAGFEMPLQLQIDSSGFLHFHYLSFSIRLKQSCGCCLDRNRTCFSTRNFISF